MAQELEELWAKMLGRIEKWASPTVASGAIFNDEDVKSPRFISQCKDYDKKNVNVSIKDWKQLQSAALKSRTPDGRGYKIGLFVNRNSDGDIFITIDAQDFLGLLEELLEYRKYLQNIHSRININGILISSYEPDSELLQELWHISNI